MFSVDMKSCTLIDTLQSWIEALESIDYFSKNVRISVHHYLLNPESSIDQLRNEIMNYDSTDVIIHSHGNNIDVSCVSIHGKDDDNNTNTNILLFPKIWKIYRNYNKYITIVKNLINDYHSGYNVQPIINQLKQILSIAIQKQPYFKKAIKINNNHNDDNEQFFTEEESEEILNLSKKLQKLYAEPLADYGIYDISAIESIINLNNNSFHIFLNTPDRDEIIGIQSKKRIITHHFHTNNNYYHGKKFIIPVRTDRHINHLLENVATVLVQEGIHDISSLKRIYINNELNYCNNYSIVLADGRIFEVTNDNEGFYISEMDPTIMTANIDETMLSTDTINLTKVNNNDPSKQNYTTLNLSSARKNKEEEKKNEFDNVIEEIIKEIGLLTTFSKKVDQKYNNTNTDIHNQYSSSITKLFPELSLNNKKSIDKKIDSLVERIHFLEYYRKACEYENVSPYEEDLKTMTNEEILEEANYLMGILQE